MAELFVLTTAADVDAYIARRGVQGSAYERILRAAVEHGWTVKAQSHINIVDIRRRSKQVGVYAGIDGRVVEAHRQTGSKGGRIFIGRGKAEQIVEHLGA